MIIPERITHIGKRLPELMEKSELAGSFCELLQRLYDHLKELGKHVDEMGAKIQQWHRESESSKRLAEIPGIAPLTATALVASIGDAKRFKNGWLLAAWLGLVPGQHSSGEKPILLGLSKRGDTYLQTLLVHGARAVIRFAENKPEASWLNKLLHRRNKNEAAVELAN